MAYLFERGASDVFTTNPNVFNYPFTADIFISALGSNWYWAVSGVMAFSTIIFAALSFKVSPPQAVFYYLTVCITMVASIVYFTMGSNLGYAAIPVDYDPLGSNLNGVNHFRQIFYVRYIGWAITTPLHLMSLLLTAGLPWPTIAYTIFLGEVMIITRLVGALVASSYKWAYFLFSLFALIYIAYIIFHPGLLRAKGINNEVKRIYLITGVWTISLWFLYPIAWVLSEGRNIISPNAEAIFYGVLDILSMPVFGAILLWGHRNIDPNMLGLFLRGSVEMMRPVKRQGYNDAINYSVVDNGNGNLATRSLNNDNNAGNSMNNNVNPNTGISTSVAGNNTMTGSNAV